jgi:hypothetical protein
MARVRQRAVVGGRATAEGEPRHLRSRHRAGLAPDQERILELQRLAGNAAVASAMAHRQSGRAVGVSAIKIDKKPSAPPDGLRTIRSKKNGSGILGYTIRSIEEGPPILKPDQPAKTDKGWTLKPRAVSFVPEPFFEEYWPTQGRHALAPHQFIDVDGDWESKLRVGEDQHVTDTTLAWELTWQTVAGIINKLAKDDKPPAHPSEDAARADLWKRYMSALPEDLRPDSTAPSTEAQHQVLTTDQGSIFRWMFDTTVVRDTRDYHTPATKPSEVGKDDISHLEVGQSNIPGPTSPELIAQVRKKYTRGAIIKGTEPRH